jgi:hypothetical protein
MKESDSITTHLNEYKRIISQLSAQQMTIDDDLEALLLMSSLPPSWETFVTTVCNASSAAVKYSEITAPFCLKMLRGKRLFRIRQVKRTLYRVRVIDHNIVEEVPCVG